MNDLTTLGGPGSGRYPKGSGGNESGWTTGVGGLLQRDGKIIEVLHGTSNPNLTVADLDPVHAMEVSDALFFTDSEDVAWQYTSQREYGEMVGDSSENVLKAHLAMSNPMIVDMEGDVGEAHRLGKLVREAKAKGHDGLVLENIDDTVDSSGKNHLSTSFAVFSKKQVVPSVEGQPRLLGGPGSGRYPKGSGNNAVGVSDNAITVRPGQQFNMRGIRNRRFMFEPKSGYIVLGKENTAEPGKWYGKHEDPPDWQAVEDGQERSHAEALDNALGIRYDDEGEKIYPDNPTDAPDDYDAYALRGQFMGKTSRFPFGYIDIQTSGSDEVALSDDVTELVRRMVGNGATEETGIRTPYPLPGWKYNEESLGKAWPELFVKKRALTVTLPLPPARAARLLARLTRMLGRADQPREPAGTSIGGRFAPEGGSADKGEKKAGKKKGENVSGISNEADMDVVREILGDVDIDDIAQSVVQHAEENFEIGIKTRGSAEADEDALYEEYQQYHDVQVTEAREKFVQTMSERGDEVDAIWQAMKAEEAAEPLSPYGDVSDHPMFSEEFTRGERVKEFVPFGDVVADLDTSAPFTEDEKNTIRERLRGTGGPQKVTESYSRTMYNEQHSNDDEGDNFGEWLSNRPSSDVGDQRVTLEFTGEDGTYMRRHFTKDDNGDVLVDHNYFRAAADTKGHAIHPGLGTDVMKGSFAEYEKNGVDRVTTHANIDAGNGGYTWARFGFKPDNPTHTNSYLRRRIENSDKLNSSEKEAALAAIRDGGDEAIWRLADLRVGDSKVGQKVLTGSDWYGHIDLSDEVAMGRLHAYLNRDRSKDKSSIPTETVTPQPVVTQRQRIEGSDRRKAYSDAQIAADRKRLGLKAAQVQDDHEMFYVLPDGTRDDIDLWIDLLGPDEFSPEVVNAARLRTAGGPGSGRYPKGSGGHGEKKEKGKGKGKNIKALKNEGDRRVMADVLLSDKTPVGVIVMEKAQDIAESLVQYVDENYDVNIETRGESTDEDSNPSEKVRIEFSGDKGTTIEREFTRDDNGDLQVEHTYFEVDVNYRGQGIATDVIKGSFEEYDKLGVVKATVHANISSGAFAWAKFGFRPNNVEKTNKYLRDRVEATWSLREEQPDVDGMHVASIKNNISLTLAEKKIAYAALDDGDPATAIWRLADSSVGYKMLNGADWWGHMKLDDVEARTRLDKFVNRPRKPKTPTVYEITEPLSDSLMQKFKAAADGGNEGFYRLPDGTKADIDLWIDVLGEDEFPPEVVAAARLRVLEFDESQPRDERGRWIDQEGGVSHWSGEGPAPADPRTFTDEQGYAWHEQGPVADWARALPYADHKELGNYASFGYGDINAQLRGKYTPNIINEVVREATPEEIARVTTGSPTQDRVTEESIAQFGHPFAKDVKDFSPDDPWHRVEDGRIVQRGGKFTIERAVPDLKYVEDLKERAGKIDASIAERGYELSEPITVGRSAYLPGVSYEDLEANVGKIFVEPGFTSTMVGDAQGRLTGYVASGKFESIYKRGGGKSDSLIKGQDEVGAAMRIKIQLPAGTKVASIEASRRLEHEFPRIQDPAVFDHPEWLTKSDGSPVTIGGGTVMKASDYTIRDYTAKPTVKDANLSDKQTRSESEVLIGSGARYRIISVKRGPNYKGSDDSLKPVPIIDVVMEYVGGGSSDGRKS